MSVFITLYAETYENGYGTSYGYGNVIAASSSAESAKAAAPLQWDESRRADVEIDWSTTDFGYETPDLPNDASGIEYGRGPNGSRFVVFELPVS